MDNAPTDTKLLTKLQSVATAVHELVKDAPELSTVDSHDLNLTRVADSPAPAFEFKLSESISKPNPGFTGRGPGRHMPVGQYVYTVTVTARYEPFDHGADDEDVR
jgi:hypothetical protein